MSEVVVERWLAAPPEDVWRYFTEAAWWTRWQGTRARIDPKPGGEIVINMGSSGDAGARGEFVLLEPPHRLVFTWGWIDAPFEGMPPGSTRVEVELRPADGGTWLRLVHSGISPDLSDQHSEGWHLYLARLAAVASGGDPGPDPSLQAGSNRRTA